MPGVVQEPSLDIFRKIHELERRIAGLERLQTQCYRDTSGVNKKIQIGLLPNGDEGLAYFSPTNDGTYHELFPSVSESLPGAVSTASTSYVDLGFPEVTAVIGASGKTLILASSFCQTAGSNQTAEVGLSIDGGPPDGFITGVESISGGAIGASTSATVVQDGLTPGAHTFKLLYASSLGGATATFSEGNLTVWPF